MNWSLFPNVDLVDFGSMQASVNTAQYVTVKGSPDGDANAGRGGRINGEVRGDVNTNANAILNANPNAEVDRKVKRVLPRATASKL